MRTTPWKSLTVCFFVLALAIGRCQADSLISSGVIPAPAIPPAWSTTSITVAHCTIPPRIDGKLDDACWQTATHISGFYRYIGATPVTEQTEAWLCADSTHLYLAFHCQDDHPNLIVTSQTQRNSGHSTDDFINVDIDSQGNRRNMSSIWVTASGVQDEYLEGGAAANITWAGDWKAATSRVADGWTAEISLPFALLRYPRGTRSFNLGLFRKLARETSDECWPYFPPQGYNSEAQYLATAEGIDLPHYAPRPVFLPYVLATAGEGSSVKEGIDVKYPLTTSMTGLLTVNPDFATVEQAVTNISFSYDQKYVPDLRPFFAEGSGFLPDSDLFYSTSIGQIDEGLKVAGKQGPTSVGLIATNTGGDQEQHTGVLSVAQDVGLFSQVRVEYAGDNQAGLPSNQVMRLQGTYGWQAGRDYYGVSANHAPSWNGDQQTDAKDTVSFWLSPPNGKASVNLSYQDIGPDFDSALGYNPELNSKGYSVNLGQYNQFGEGHIEQYAFGLNASSYDYHTGGFFHNDVNGSTWIAVRSGQSYSFGFDSGQRIENHDHTYNANWSWGTKTLYQQGSIGVTAGSEDSSQYQFTSISQSILVTRPFSVQESLNDSTLGGVNTVQNVVTGNYLLSATDVVGGRIITQNGATDVFLSFSRQVRRGSDIFLLFGDPNSPITRDIVTLKVVTPF